MEFIVILSIIGLNFFIGASVFIFHSLGIDLFNLYYPFEVLLGVVSLIYFSYKIVIRGRIKKSNLLLVAFIILIVISFLVSSHKTDKLVITNFLLFFTWSVPAALCGIYVSDFSKERLEKYFKIIYIAMFVFLLGGVMIPHLLGVFSYPYYMGVMNYQNATYIAAFTAGLGLYFLSEKNTLYNTLFLVSFLILTYIVTIASGRGGMLLLLVYITVFFARFLLDRKIHIFYRILLLFVLIGSFLLLFNVVEQIDKSGRIFSYIDDNGISLENASGRDEVIEDNIKAFKGSPLIGYGFFNYYQLTFSVPHNLFFEVLLISGLIGFSLFIIFILYMIIKYLKVYSDSHPDKLVGFIFLYPLVLLMFSTNFLIVSEFWFATFYILSRSNKSNFYLD